MSFRSRLSWLFLAVLPSLALSLQARSAKSGPRVNLTTGAFEGLYNGTMEVFLGIPYAEPPLGSLRFRAPQSAPAHEGVLAAKTWSDGCHQIVPDFAFQNAKFTEDCLYLNVFRSGKVNSNTLLPILFWIHGGAFSNGAASEGLYIPYDLIDYADELGEPFIYVSINYRLNGFGFLAHPDLPEADNSAGLLDQLAALRFVHANARAFGGDPSKITIWGQSAGAGSVAYHTLFSNPAEGLFRSTILTSGNHIANPVQIPKLAVVPGGSIPPLLAATNCTDLECLRAAPADTLLSGVETYLNNISVIGTRIGFPPVLGGYIAELPSVRIATTSRAGSLPTLLTSVTDEGTIFTTGLLGTTPSLYEGDTFITDSSSISNYNNYHVEPSTFTGLDELYDVNSTSLLSPFDANGNVSLAVGVPVSSYVMRTTAMVGDKMVVSPRRAWLKAALSRGKEAKRQWSSRFDQLNPAFPAFLGVYHVSDLYMLYGQNPASGNDSLDVELRGLSRTMQSALINFVTNQDPQLGCKKQRTLSWPPYHVAQQQLVFKVGNLTMEEDTYRKPQTDFLHSIIDQLER